jgi:hypothetical protein
LLNRKLSNRPLNMRIILPIYLLTVLSFAGIDDPIRQVAPPSAYLDVTAERLRVLPHTIEVTFKLSNKSTEDLDLSKVFWKATYGKAFGGIKSSELDGIMLASKQKRLGDITFMFDEKLDRQSLLNLQITNIKTLKGKTVPNIVLKFQAQSAAKNTTGVDARRQEDTLIQWSQVR